MKKVLLYGIAALAALSFSSCQKEVAVEENNNLVTVTLRAEKAGIDTRTEAVEEDSQVSFKWTAEDKENLKLFVVGKDNKGNDTFTPVDRVVNISSDYKTLTVTATVEESSTLRAVVSGAWTSGNKPKVNTIQSPATDNLDPNADVLVADDIVADGLTDALLTFRRPVTINKMTLKNMGSGELVHEITVSSDKVLIGYYDKDGMSGQTTGGNAITLNYDDVAVTGDFPVYFVTMPQQGNTLTVVVKTNKFTYTKSFGPVNFTEGMFSRFSVKLPTGIPVVDTDYTGDWVITGVNGEVVSAALAYVNGNNNLKSQKVTLNLDDEKILSTVVDDIKMHFEKVTTGDYAGLYTIKDNSGNYLYAAGTGTNNHLKGNQTINGAGYYWNVEKESNGTYTIKASSSNRNVMQYNSGSSIFSCYETSTSQKPVTLYPASWLEEEEQEEVVNESTLENPYTPAQVNELAQKLGTRSLENVYVSGIVNEVSISTQYGNADYYISADGSTTDRFYIYRGKYLDGAVFTSDDQLNVGDEVTVCGTLVLYNGITPEFTSNSKIVSIGSEEPDPDFVGYIKVTSSNDLTDGQYLIVYEGGNLAFDGSRETLDAISNTITVSISASKIEASETIDASAFIYDATEGYLKSASGLYIGQTSDANGLMTSSDPLKNEVTIVDGNANIVGSGGAYLRYNKASNQTRFRYYKSASYTNQEAISLYKRNK